LGDSLVFFGDLGALALGDFVDLAFAALAFLGDVASFLGLDVVVVFLVVVDEAFFVAVFFGDLAFEAVDFLGDLVAVVDDFFELDVDLFFGEEGAVVDVPDVPCVVVVDTFFVADFFFLTLFFDPGASL